MSETGTIQIPVLFDMEGGSAVFGEDATGADFVDSHLQFLLDMTTEANGISLNASDISSAILVADQDTGDNIFFDGDSKGIGIDNLCNRIAKAITRGKLVHVPSVGNYSNSGIPVGGEGHLYDQFGNKMPGGGYTLKYKSSIAPVGDEQMLGQAMARVASVHLIGDPLGSAAFEDATSIQRDLETTSGQTFNQGMTAFYNALAVQLSKVLGGSKSSAPMNPGILVGSEQYSTAYDLVTTSNDETLRTGSQLTGQVYTSSQNYSDTTYPPSNAFDKAYNTVWISKNGSYVTSTGEHNLPTVMTGVNGVTTNNNSWDGIWIKADVGETVVLSEYKIYPYHHSTRYRTAPRHAYLLSSPDNINWQQIHELDITDDAAGRLLYRDANNAYIPVTIDLTSSNNREGRYFALVIDKTFSGTGRNYCIIKELQLNGVTKAEFDGGSPPAAYDIASGKANSAYTASSNYSTTSYQPFNAFNGETGSGYGWLSTNGSFDNTTGLRSGAYLEHSLASGLRGEWLQVDLSQNVNVMQMHLIGQTATTERLKEGYLLSSKDGNNWDIVHTLDSNNWVVGTTFADYIVDFSGTPTGAEDIKIGRSWRLLITKIYAPTNGYFRLFSFQLNGIVFPTDFGSAPSSTNEVYTNNVTAYDITSWDDHPLAGHSIITNQHYSASSRYNASYDEKNAFMDDGESDWRTGYNFYNTTDGLYQHNTWTGPYRGEWIQVDLSENFIVKNYLIEGYRSTNASYKKASPRKGYLLSSLDNKRWRLAHTFNTSSNDASEYYNATDKYRSIYNDVSNNQFSVGRYWRFVIEKVFPGATNGMCGIRNFKLLGVKETEETKTNGQSTKTFVDDYTLTVTPYDLTSNNKSNNKNTVSDLSGVYSSSSIHNTSSYQSFRAFEATDVRWQSLSMHYNTSAPDASGGTYYGNIATGPYRGEWIQVDVGETVFADNYIISGYVSNNRSYRNMSPKKGYLLSSLDGKKWRLAHTFEETTIDADYTYNTSTGYGKAYRDISNNENAIGRYWRFVTEKIFTASSGYASISTFKINGGKYPSEVIQGDITTTTQDNTIYTLNVTPYDLTTHTVSGAEGTWGTYNPPSTLTGHVYTSSSYNSTSYYAYESFTTSENSYGWRSIASCYNTTQGTYRGQHMTGPYKGEWIQVDLSENVFADNYLIGGYKSTNATYYKSSPKKGYLLSSLDNKTWRLVHTFEEETTDYIYNTETGYSTKTNDISNNKNAIGRYWRFVIEKVFESNGGYVHMAQFKINGGKYPSEVSVGDGAETTTIKNYTLTETAYDFTSVQGGLSLDQLPVRNENLNNRFSSSSYASASYLTKNAFSGYNSGRWLCYDTPYNAGSGLYYGSHSTGPYKGEWLQVDLSENYIASSYVLAGYQNSHNAYKASSPKKAYLLSSLDGKTWRLAHTFEETNDLPDYTYDSSGNNQKYNEITCNDNAIGRYWRFVTEKVFASNSGYVAIQMLTIYGVKESQKIEGVVSTDISRNNPGYILNATGYNLTNSDFSVLTGHEYSSSSNGSTSYLPSKAFQQASGEWRSHSQYNATSGTYYGTEFTGPYKGEWLQVDLSENVFAENYLIAGYQSSHGAYYNTSPKKGYLLSSLDNKTWRLAHTFEETTDDAEYTYNSTDQYGVRINNIAKNENAIGRYWRFVVEKVFASNSGHTTIRDFVISGVKYPSQVTVQNLAVDPSLNILKELPADMSSIYDLVSTTSTITGQAYSASTIHTATTYDPIKAFTNDTNRWLSTVQYNTTAGTYRGNKLTGEYYGEWIQVDIGENVVIGQYKIHPYYTTHGPYFDTSPKKGFLLSSLDGNKWDLVHNFEVADTSAYNYSSTQTPVTITLNGDACKGRYFRFVVNKIFPSNDGYTAISQIEILGVKENQATISSESKVNRYNTFTNNTTPYDIYRRTLAHNTTPYLISTPVSSLVPIDIVSQNSTVSGQSYSATYGTAGNAFDNSGNTEWSTDASSNYGIISSLITNEPNFSSWAAAADGVISTFSENITVTTIDKSNFSIYDTSTSSIIPIHSVEISNGKLLVRPLTGYQYNNNVAEYDLTSTASPLYGTRGDITFTSEYNHNSHRWTTAFDAVNNGPALFASNSWSGSNPVGGVDFVIDGVTYHGHWVQLDVGQNVLVKTFEYTPRNAYQQNEWDTLLIAGSKDGTTWDLLWRETGRAQSTASVKETYAVNATDIYSQFRWLCEKTTGSASYAFNALEITLLGQTEAEASLVAFTASKLNDYRITYTKPLNQDNQLKGVTNGVAVQSFVLEDGAVTGRGEFAILPLSLNEPSFTSSQVVSGKLEYTFSENLQAGAGGFDITDFQLIEPSGNTVDLSSNITGIVGGKLVIGTYSAGFNVQGNNYALSGPNATHSGSVSYSYSTQVNSGQYAASNAFDGNTGTRWASANTYSSGTYSGSVSTVTTNAGTINGEWIQVDTGKLSVLSHFTYLKNADSGQDPTTSSIAGSIDNSTWTVITSFSYDKDNDPNEVTKNISTQAEYRYYRFIYTVVAGSGYASCQEWTLFGHIKDDYYIGETITDTNYMLVYNKNSTNNKHIIGATNNVAINSFRVDNNILIGRGGVTNIGQYDGSTSTTLTDTSTYKGEYIQVDVGKNVIINNYAINVKSFNGNDNPKSWMLVGSLNGSDWTKIDEVFNTTLLSNYVGGVTATTVRYLRLIVNRGGAAKHIKISEFKVNGVTIRLEGQTYSASIDNGDANTVFDNSIATSWNTSSAYNYNGIDAAAANEATYSSIQLHTDASGNNKIELTFSADLSSNNLKFSDFSVTETDFSATIPILADISGGKLMIEKQANVPGSVYYEDFDDQSYLGNVTTADISGGGIKNAISFQPVETRREVQMVNGASISYHANYHSITELNGKYYMSTATSVVDELDPVNNTLTRIATSGGRVKGGMAFFAYNGSLYFYGGGENSNETTDTQLDSYNPSTGTWTFNISTTGTAPRHYNGGFVVEGSVLYVSGGTKSTNTSKLDLTTMAWTTIDTTAGNIIATPHFVYNNRLYRYGASTTWQGRSGGLSYLDLANPGNGWTSVTINDPNNVRTHVDQRSGFSGARRGAKGVAVKDGKMYYVSGWDEYFTYEGYYTDILHYIDLTNNTVYEIQSGMTFPDMVARHQHFFVGDILYLFAGGTLPDSGIVNVYSPNIYKIDTTKTATQYGYRLQGDSTATPPKIWRITDQTFLAVSFWFKRSSTSGTIFDSYNSTDSNATYSGGDGQKDRMKIVSGKPRLRTRSPANIERWYQNGIQCSTPAASEHHGTDGHTAMHADSWHHIYVEFKTPNDRIQFFANGLSSLLNADSGSVDEVRLYNTSVSEAHIIQMAQGWNGMYPGASFDKTDYLIEYQKNADPLHNIYDVNNTSVPINDFILRNGSLISRGTNFGHYSGSTTTTLADNSTSTGEYIEVNMGQQTYVTEYELHVPSSNQHPDNNVYPKSWVLLGSTDGSTWSKIHEVTDYTGWTTSSSYSSGYKVSYMTEVNNMVAQYYRLIINKTYGKVGYTSVAELLIKGVKHTSETTGVTQVKTASLGTAANAFDGSVSTGWDTSSSATYSLIATPATNEPTFSSIAVNTGKLEVTFSENVAVTGSLDGNDFNITDSGTRIHVTPTIANNKLVLEYLGIPTSQIYHESFDNEDVTFHANADIVYVDGRGGGKAMSTIGQSPSGGQWEQKVSAGNLPADVRAVSFHIKTGTVGDSQYIFDNREGDGVTDNRVLWFQGSALKFWNNSSTNGTASGSGYLATGTMPNIYYNGTLQVYGTNNASYGAPVGDIDFNTLSDGNWHHFYIEYPAGETLPKEFNWLARHSYNYNLQATIDDLRYYNAPLLQANIDSLAAGGAGGLTGSFTHTNVDITYTKNATAAKNIVNAAHTSVPVNTFFISNGVEMSRGSTGKGDYRGTTSTTLPDSSTYNGEWIQIDIGQMILMTEIKLVVPNKDAYTNPKSWKLLVSSDNTNWIELLDITDNTEWDSGFGSASTQFTGFEIGPGLANQHIGRYFKIIVNSIIGPSNHVKINEIVIKGVMHTIETDVVNGPYPTLYTATPSNNTTSNDTTVTTTKHNADDTVTTTTVETTVDIASNTVTTTTTKTTVAEVTSAVTLNTATESSTTSVESDTTALTTTYNNNDTSVRTVVNKTIDISANTDTTTNLNTIITTTVTGFNIVQNAGSSFDPNKIYDASGVSCPALKSIYEQLMNVPGRAQIMQSRDFTSSPMPSAQTITGGFPFIPGDKLVMYLRPKIVFAQATFPEQFTSLIGFGGVTFGEPVIDTALAAGGAITGQTYTESSKYSDTYAGSKLFDGSTTTFWITASNTYGTDGVATGGSTTIHADDGGGTYTGHYVQIQFANSVAIEDIKITPRYGGGGGAGEPKEFRILSSDDGSTFRVAYSVAEGDLNNDWSLWSTQAFHLPNLRNASSKGKYWRIAVGKITTGNKVQLAKVELIGNLTSTLIGNDIGAPIVTGGGSGPDLASQIYHEDFQDQSYDGSVTGAPVVSVTGRTGQTTYVVETKISATERWVQTGYSTAKTFSFWHKYIAGGKTSGTYIFEKVINGGYTSIYYTTSNSTLNFEGYNTANSTFYLNGVAQNSNGSISHDATQWTHYCFVFNDTNATGKINWGHPGRGYESQTVYHTNGYFDDVRIFNEELTASQIADLAAGENGNSGKNHPYDIASSNSTLSGQTYTASSTYREADYAASEAFDNSWTVPNDSWVTGNNKYSNGIYAGYETTDGYAGEWVQVDIGQEVVLKSFEIHPRYSQNSTLAPKNMRLFSSTDGTNWSQVYDFVNLTHDDWGDAANVTASNAKSVGPYTTNTTGRYFRLVINQAIGNTATYCQISELVLKGLTAAEEAANQALARGDPITTTYPTSTLTGGYPTTGSILDISGLETNITKLSSTFPALFPGNATSGPEAEATKFGWVGSANADTLSLETTDEKDTRTMDLHIWKITITL